MNKKFYSGYFSYLLNSKNLHGIHSPFVYSFAKDVIYNNKKLEIFEEIENLRKSYHKDFRKTNGWDFGKNLHSSKSISEITKQSAKSPKYCSLLYRIAKWKNPPMALEFGTSLGFSSFYISKALENNGKLLTFEGNNDLADIAISGLNNLNINNTEVIKGNFDETLLNQIEQLSKIDFVFFDGNHHLEPTLRYFEICLNKANENTVFVFDDIYWSAEMKKAWYNLKSHKSVSLTIDLFFMGIVFINKRLNKEHFKIRF